MRAVRLPTWLRRVALVLLGLGFVWSMAMFWLPAVLKGQAERLLGEQLGRQVQIGQIEFRPWTLELTVHDLVLRDQAGTGDQFRIGRLYVELAWKSLVRLAPIVDAVQLDAPWGRLTHLGEGRYDIDDILARVTAPSTEPAGKPLAFALYNLGVAGGAFDFVDQPKDTTHTLRGLTIGLPFLSNFPADREVKTVPKLAFQLNGSGFDSAAESVPFADSRATEARMHIAALDLAAYLPYLPAELPLRPRAGVVEADLVLRFAQTPETSVTLQGQVRLHGFLATDAAQQEVLRIPALAVDIADLQPLRRSVALRSVQLTQPWLHVQRDAAGRLQLLPASTSAVEPATPAAPPANAPSAPGWSLTLDQFRLQDASVRWTDHSAAPAGPSATLLLDRLMLQVNGLRWPFAEPARLEGSAQLTAAAGADGPVQGQAATLAFSGTATDRAADLEVRLDRADLAMVAPYLAGVLRPTLHGELSAQATLSWKPDALVVTAERMAVERLALRARDAGAPPLPTLRLLELRNAKVDLARHHADIGSVQLTEPRLAVQRDKKGRWMFEDWLQGGAATAPTPDAASAATPAWTWGVGALALDGGVVEFADQAAARPVVASLSGLELRLRTLQSDLTRPVQARLVARVGATQTSGGRLAFEGQVAPQPLVADGRVDITQFPVAVFEPYFGDALNLQLERADTSFAGSLRLALASAGPTVHIAGDLGVQDLRARARAGDTGGRELLSWNALRLRGLDLGLAPGSPTRVAVQETLLTDFYARVIVNEDGRINLQDLVRPSTDAPVPAGAAASAPVAAGPPPEIRFGPIRLQNGRVLFSDRFVKPNYTANLSELNGGLSAFASASAGGATAGGAPVLADLELRGRAEGTASLEITGKLNPLADPLALDIRGKVRDLELPPLSPYAVKYAGHGIERGKLSVDVHYQVQPDGRLTATNSLVLNQLTFGDAVPGAPASLPVRLATALLADRHGVIDLNLPIQGSLNDPEFSLGPVIFKAIVNLVVKAVTAPFSLLASAFGGGGEDLGAVEFQTGSALLGEPARQSLDKVATALADRPQLKLTVVGHASLEAEQEGLRRERLRRMVQAEKRRNAAAVGTGAAAEPPAARASAPAPVTDEEYPALLKSLYQRTEMTKPRNAVGLARDLPLAEMEALLLANMNISEEAVRQLALQRGVAVRDYLASRQVPLERLFLGAVKLAPAGDVGTPRADLELATP